MKSSQKQTQRIRKNTADVVGAIVPVLFGLRLFALESSLPTVVCENSVSGKLHHSVSVKKKDHKKILLVKKEQGFNVKATESTHLAFGRSYLMFESLMATVSCVFE